MQEFTGIRNTCSLIRWKVIPAETGVIRSRCVNQEVIQGIDSEGFLYPKEAFSGVAQAVQDHHELSSPARSRQPHVIQC
jgi:hypothetical protein